MWNWVYIKKTQTLLPVRSTLIQLCAGILAFVLFILLQSIILRFVSIGLFWICAILQRKRIRIVYFIIVLLAVVVSHILIPKGSVVLYVFSFPITLGALQQGMFRGQSFIAMVFFSLAGVHRGIIPSGRFGSLLVQTFVYFELLFKTRKFLHRWNMKYIGRDLSTHLQSIIQQPGAEESTLAVYPFSLLFCCVWVATFSGLFVFDRMCNVL